jgi:hypothetical protein
MQEIESAAVTACGTQGSSVGAPFLSSDEQLIDINIMVKF